MKIAILTQALPPSADATEADLDSYDRAHALAALGHTVHVLTLAEDDAGADHTQYDGRVAITRIAAGALPRRARLLASSSPRTASALAHGSALISGLRRHLRREVVDVVDAGAELSAAALLALGDVPLVVRVVETPTAPTNLDDAANRALGRAAARGAGVLVATSQWLRRHWPDQRAAARAAVCPPGISLPALDDERRTDPRGQLPDGDRQLLVAPDCGPDDLGLLDELATALDITVVYWREDAGNDDRALEAAPAAAEGGAVLRLPGATAATRRHWLATADVVLCAMRDASAPRAALEAMALRRAIVAWRTGGLAELLEAGDAGALIATDDREALLRSCRRLLDDDALRRQLGHRARKRVERQYDASRTARRSIAIYQSVVDRAAATAPVRAVPTNGAAPRHLLAPDNWHSAWWLADTRRQPPGLALDESGLPLFARLPLEALRLVDGILMRSWGAGEDDWQSEEGDFLRALHDLHLEVAEAVRARGATPQDGLGVTLPGFRHPMFAGALGAWIVGQVAQVQSWTEVQDWLVEQVADPEFAVEARTRPELRRLALLAAERRPTPATYSCLRRIYRDPATHAAVVAEDLDSRELPAEALQRLQALGLHAPLPRPLYRPAPVTVRAATSPDLDPTERSSLAQENSEPPDPTPAVPTDAPRVTVLIPAYRHEQFVADAAHSALRQADVAVRVLLVDDRSPDATLARAEEIDDPRLTVRQNATNLGLGASVEAALRDVDTPYVALLNSDDLFHPDRLAICLASLDEDPQRQLVATGLAFIDGESRELTAETSCAIDVGPKTHGWLQWFAEITADPSFDDWASMDHLLRHNHLATSSNIVVRTEYLRQQMPRLRDLKYTLDWLLFLSAAIDGGLHFIDQPLLAYRFHANNTVWFDDGGRGDYVLEVNRVLLRALEQIVDRELHHGGDDAARCRLATALHEAVAAHSDADGFAMTYAALAPLADAQGSSLPAALDALADDATRRAAREAVLGDLDTSPWELRALARDGAQLRALAPLAEAFALRAHELRCQRDLARTAPHQGNGDADGAPPSARGVGDLLAQADEIRQLREELALFRQRRTELRYRVDNLQRKLKDAEARRDELGWQYRSTTKKLSELDRKSRARQRELRRERDRERLEHEQLATAGQIARAQTYLEREELLKNVWLTHEWQAGEAVLFGLRLAPVWKTAHRLLARYHNWRAYRGARRAQRDESGPTALLVCFGPLDRIAAERLSFEARRMTEAGIPLRLVAWGNADAAAIGAINASARQRCTVLHDDGDQQQRDRAFWLGRNADAVAAVERELRDAPSALARVFGAARVADIQKSRYVHGIGGGETAMVVRAVARLCGREYGLSVGGEDVQHALDRSLADRHALIDAAALAVDCAQTHAALSTAISADLAPCTPQSPAIYADAAPPPAPAKGGLRVLLGGPLRGHCMATLVDAVGRAADAGLELQLRVLQPRLLDDLAALEDLRDRLHITAHGSRLTVLRRLEHGLWPPADTDVVLALAHRGVPGLDAGVVAALAAGVATVCHPETAMAEALAPRGALLVDSGDAAALTALLQRLTDAERRAEAGQRARRAFADKLAPGTADPAFVARVRDFLQAAPTTASGGGETRP